jgi:hypothetical protein
VEEAGGGDKASVSALRQPSLWPFFPKGSAAVHATPSSPFFFDKGCTAAAGAEQVWRHGVVAWQGSKRRRAVRVAELLRKGW